MTSPTGILYSEPRVKPLSTTGAFQPGCYLNFYITGTTTPTNVYSDGTLMTPISQPVTADSAGRFAAIYMDPTVVYRVQLYSAAAVLLEDTDPYVVAGVTTGATLFNPGTVSAPGVAFTGSSGTGLYIPSTNNLGFATNGTAAGTVSSSQAWNLPAATGSSTMTIAAPPALSALTINAGNNVSANNYVAVINGGNGTTGHQSGLQINAGTSTADNALLIQDNTATITYFAVRGGDGNIYGLGKVAAVTVNMSPDSGSYTGTLTGCTTSPTCTIQWRKMGNLVTMTIGAISATSNTNAMTITGSMPASIQTSTTQWVSIPFLENNTGFAGTQPAVQVAAGSTTLTFAIGGSASGFTNSGTKGISAAASFTYMLN